MFWTNWKWAESEMRVEEIGKCNLEENKGVSKMNKPKVDIFYKTYPGDEIWVNYSLMSVFKYAKGFRQIVVVSNRGHNYNPPPGNLPINYIELTLPQDNIQYPHGVGYWWQMGIKLCWDRFTDADEVVVLDSDNIFYDYFSPDSWRRNGQIIWLRRLWSESGDGVMWKNGSDYFLRKETPYDYMVSPSFYCTRTALHLFADFMRIRFGQTPDQFYVDLRHPRTISDYVLLGAYLEEIKHNEYCFYHPKELNWKHLPIKQYWSWGRIDNEIRKEIEGFLK
jgi:hypothetical protein